MCLRTQSDQMTGTGSTRRRRRDGETATTLQTIQNAGITGGLTYRLGQTAKVQVIQPTLIDNRLSSPRTCTLAGFGISAPYQRIKAAFFAGIITRSPRDSRDVGCSIAILGHHMVVPRYPCVRNGCYCCYSQKNRVIDPLTVANMAISPLAADFLCFRDS